MTADGGHLDIYSLKPIKIKKPVLTLSGFVMEKASGDFVAAQASIRYEHDGEVVGMVRSDTVQYDYRTTLPSEGKYYLQISAPGYLAATDSIEITAFTSDTTAYKDIYLKAIEVGVSVRLDNIFFDYNETTLRDESFPALDKVVEMMEENPKLTIEIGGHTDNRGAEDYNQRLSQGRAEAVRQYLVDNLVEPDRVTARGYGESQPEAHEDNEESWQTNRRVEFTVLGK